MACTTGVRGSRDYEPVKAVHTARLVGMPFPPFPELIRLWIVGCRVGVVGGDRLLSTRTGCLMIKARLTFSPLFLLDLGLFVYHVHRLFRHGSSHLKQLV